MRTNKEIFQQGSQTYYNSSILFDKKTRQDVFKFYSFVRVVDDFVDQIPQDKKSFNQIKVAYRKRSVLNGESGRVLQNMYYIEEAYGLGKNYMAPFMKSMEMDLLGRSYKNMDELLVYIYGSAEIIGEVMCKIIGVPKEGLPYARMLGRSMQYINFIRDIDEDNGLGREYIPRTVQKKFGVKSLKKPTTQAQKDVYVAMIRAQIDQYNQWRTEAEKGFRFIPRRSRIAIKTASDMYAWTAAQIYNDPLIVFEEKVKPTKFRILRRALKNVV